MRELLVRAVDGESLLALIGGEAGVGKTRLADELATAASEQGVRVLRGGCVPLGEDGLPFAPVTEALRSLARELDPAELKAVAGPAGADLPARLVADVYARSEGNPFFSEELVLAGEAAWAAAEPAGGAAHPCGAAWTGQPAAARRGRRGRPWRCATRARRGYRYA